MPCISPMERAGARADRDMVAIILGVQNSVFDSQSNARHAREFARHPFPAFSHPPL